MAKFGLLWSNILVSLGLLVVVAIGGRKTIGRALGLLLIPFLLGCAMAMVNPLDLNMWMGNSLIILESKWRPVRFPPETNRIVLDEARQSALQATVSKLHVSDYDETMILVSFVDEGLALLDKGKITFFSGTGVILSTALPDNSFFTINLYGPQVLRRAVIRENGLQILWERLVPDMALHHWGDVFEGKLYQPGRDFVDLPNTLSQQIGYKYGRCETEDSRNDVIRVFDVETGEYERDIPIMPAIAAMEGEGGEAVRRSIPRCDDPIHVNRVRVLQNAREAGYFPEGKVGDLLISMRNTSTIFLLDKDTFRVKWSVKDEFEKQHDPTVTDRGTLLVFDNLGSNVRNGESRIIEIDIATRNVVGMYEATGNDYFDSYVRGKIIYGQGKIFVEEQQGMLDRSVPATMFTLECPGRFISNDCTKTYIFKADPPAFTYENAVLLPRKKGEISL
jgi:hypothetical protein